MKRVKRKRLKRPFFLGGGGGADEGPVFAVPVPVGGRFPVVVEGAGGLALTSAGVGGVNGDCSGVIDLLTLGVVVVLADCRTGGCGTPAVVLLRLPGKTT